MAWTGTTRATDHWAGITVAMTNGNIIALVGAGCTGKTTLLDTCARGIEGAVCVPEVARSYFDKHPTPIGLRFTFETQACIQALTIEAHCEASQRSSCVVADRSVIDAAVYVTAAGDPWGGMTLLDRARPWLSLYGHVFLADPSGVPFVRDGVRREDDATRQRLHRAFCSFFATHGIPYMLLSGTVEDRWAQLTAAVGLHPDRVV